jgi:dolichyl-phosphate-mannose-protein mannosyltransferase
MTVLVKKLSLRVIRWEYFWLSLIVIASLGLHLSLVALTPETISDEVYYAGYYPQVVDQLHYGDAYAILHNQHDERPEHPPLGKLMIAAGIRVLGDNPWGWRVPSILTGGLGLVLFYLICRTLQMSRLAANLAVFLLAFENLNFLMSGIAMLDVFMVTLTLAFFLLYLRRQYILSGVFIGLASLAKLIALMGAPSLVIHWYFTQQPHSRRFIATVIAAPLAFMLFLTLFDSLIAHQLVNPLPHLKDMVTLSGGLTFKNVSHPDLARPWAWLLNYHLMPFHFGHFSSPAPTWLGGYSAAVSLAIWPLIIPLALFMAWRAIRGSEAALFGTAWFIGTFVLWIPLSIASDRASYGFYIYPAIGSLCLGLGLALAELIGWLSRRRKLVKAPVWAAISLLFLVHLATLAVISPVLLRG